MGTKIGLEWVVGSTVVPATAMIMMKQPGIAAGIVGAGLVAAVLIVRIEARAERDRARAERDRAQELLTYASTATSLGSDPARVVEAMRAGAERPEDLIEEARRPQWHVPRGCW